MVKKRAPRVLFFTANAMPTEAEYALADDLGGNVGFRNGKIAGTNTKPETCDAVAAIKGHTIPLVYANHQVPRVRSAADVAKLKPSFKRDIGYSDDEPEDDDAPVVVPSAEGEPQAGDSTSGEGDGSGNAGDGGEDGKEEDAPSPRRGRRATATPAPAPASAAAPAPAAGEPAPAAPAAWAPPPASAGT